jgi:hypothetical protein
LLILKIHTHYKDGELDGESKKWYDDGKLNIHYKDVEMNEDKRCVICFENIETRNKALVPCGHTQYCGECITKITQCSLCNVVISQIITLF